MIVDQDMQSQRIRFVALLRAWMAQNNGVTLLRRELATHAEVMAVRCPRHGWAPCWGEWDGRMLRRGCLGRQIEALRSDYFPPQQSVVGALDDGSRIDSAAVLEVHHGA